MTIAEILRAAKAHLIERGWCQGDKLAIHGAAPRKCCAATAMQPFIDHGVRGFEKPGTLFRKVNGITGNIADWNDAPERTLEDVLAAYDKAIAAAERDLPACPGPYDWCVYANQCAADDCRRNTAAESGRPLE